MYFPSFLHCTFPSLCSCRDIVTVLIKRIIHSTVQSSPELLYAVAASASVWGAGSLQVLELTPASRVSTCTRKPPSLRPAGLLNPRACSQAPLQCHPHRATKILVLFVWMDTSTLSLESPQHFTQGFLWKPEPQLLPLSLLTSIHDLTQSLLWILSGPRVVNSPASVVLCSSIELSKTFDGLI